MRITVIYVALALVAGLLIGVLIDSDDGEDSKANATATNKTGIIEDNLIASSNREENRFDQQIARLDERLQKEVVARQGLQKQLETLQRQVANLEPDSRSQISLNDSSQDDELSPPDDSSANNDWLDEQILIDNGMSAGEVADLKTNFEQLEMERLLLRDQSIRESWDRQKYIEELQAVSEREDALEQQMSESVYDAYLYASGQPNRVSVSSVLSSAQAEGAGIQPGDYIVRYDDQRIYNAFDLREATTSGNLGESVTLEVERDGRTLQIYLTRGPLGIRMNSASVAP